MCVCVCVCVCDLQRLIGHSGWMPITDCFMELALVFRHHKQLMTSLFLLLENLFQSLFRLPVSERKTSGRFSRLTGCHGQLFIGWYMLALPIQVFLGIPTVFSFNETFWQKHRKESFYSRWIPVLISFYKMSVQKNGVTLTSAEILSIIDVKTRTEERSESPKCFIGLKITIT